MSAPSPKSSRRGIRFSALLLTVLFVAAGLPPGTNGTARAAPATQRLATGPVSNFTSALNRLVELVAAGGAALLALVWARVAISWFSHDITKKVQARDRARDALIGTLVFTAAVTGLVWGLAQWVLTGA